MSRPLESLPNTLGSEGAAERLRNLVASALPGAQIVRVRSLGPDAGTKDANTKGAGYGAPLRIDVHHEGRDLQLVLRSATANQFGHDRRADRAEAAILAADTFGALPRHVSVLDMGAYKGESEFVSLAGTGEFYLLTSYSAGRIYAEDLREIARSGLLNPRDLARCQSLVDYLAELHAHRPEHPNTAYARFLRDTLGSGEGIFGIIDGYPDDVPAAPRCRLEHIEELCLRWRHRLRKHHDRLRRTHGDFHPFNVLFDEASELAVLDTSRGSVGDPADDIASMAINYAFFALGHPGAWHDAFRTLFYLFWERYGAVASDSALAEVVAPLFAWRGLVLASPTWYPELRVEDRERILCFIERVLEAPRFAPQMADDFFDT